MKSRRLGLAVATVMMAAGVGSIQSVHTNNQVKNIQNTSNAEQRVVHHTNQAKLISPATAIMNRWGGNGSFKKYAVPTNHESFKQARRKQLAKKSYKKAKKLGRV